METNDIAIIGMAGVFPGASNVQQYWENILHKVNAISDAPPEWEAELFFEENTKADDRTLLQAGRVSGQARPVRSVQLRHHAQRRRWRRAGSLHGARR